jgi:2'-hydroxyisoflavone reductase
MRILILGGTRFLGRALTGAAAGRGDTVTLFNRGRSAPGLFPGIETITGDRTSDLSGLEGRDWDAVIDVAGYEPGTVALSARALDKQTGRYVFVSTVSVYADQSSRESQAEDSALWELRDDMTDPGELYGARKASAEGIVTGVYGDRALIPRPGLIVGPHDTTDRFPYWPRRIARGGLVLAPGDPSDLVQFIDVRDLAAWIVEACHHDTSGVFNLVGNPMTFRTFLDECRAATYSDAELTWVGSDRLLAAGAVPWTGLPLWLGDLDPAGFSNVDNSRAVATGLTLRPAAGTIRDTLAWDTERGGRPPDAPSLSPEDEARLISQASLRYLPQQFRSVASRFLLLSSAEHPRAD